MYCNDRFGVFSTQSVKPLGKFVGCVKIVLFQRRGTKLETSLITMASSNPFLEAKPSGSSMNFLMVHSIVVLVS